MPEIKVMVDGGKATPAPPLGPALSPLGLNVGKIVQEINEKTKSFAGMKVPVVVEVDAAKNYTITVGSPPTSALIKAEAKADKGAGNPKTEVKGNITFDQVMKIAEMKMGKLNSYNMRSACREIIGSCNSMGITVDGKHAKEAQKDFADGKYDSHFK
ncbi:MAG: 50S ribosomal protein L11 [Candidatus Iainarchaeum archaeon]|uniref:Large ribosomal subunit protein uL11 n=1 Tax=Candidatus Iainarchaeum sp. TaxID=3101447 RepID=A0A7T9I2U5_9ARCH|nr:MAG: 50S ribosomal protein L11 [Candidatus Diapherotrites archaeon]